eukprot:ANDGO_03530.mRNA.1 Transmembrane protein 56 homolog B
MIEHSTRPDSSVGVFSALSYVFSNLAESYCSLTAFFFILCLLLFFFIGKVVFHPFFPQWYDAATELDEIEWRNRFVSSFHALVSFILSVLSLTVDSSLRDSPIYAYNNISYTCMCFTSGYFLADSVMMLNHRHLYAHAMLAHHYFALFGICVCVGFDLGHFFPMYLTTTEATTPLVNFVFYLQQAKLENSKIFKVNGGLLAFVWLFARVANIPYYWYVVAEQWDGLMSQQWLVPLVLLANGALLGTLNTIWFVVIVKSMVSALRGQGDFEHNLEAAVHEFEHEELDDRIASIPRKGIEIINEGRAYVSILTSESDNDDDDGRSSNRDTGANVRRRGQGGGGQGASAAGVASSASSSMSASLDSFAADIADSRKSASSHIDDDDEYFDDASVGENIDEVQVTAISSSSSSLMQLGSTSTSQSSLSENLGPGIGIRLMPARKVQ